MLWLRMSTAPHKNELIHTRRWSDVVDVGNRHVRVGQMVERITAPPELGYRTPAEVEAEFWEHHPSQK